MKHKKTGIYQHDDFPTGRWCFFGVLGSWTIPHAHISTHTVWKKLEKVTTFKGTWSHVDKRSGPSSSCHAKCREKHQSESVWSDFGWKSSHKIVMWSNKPKVNHAKWLLIIHLCLYMFIMIICKKLPINLGCLGVCKDVSELWNFLASLHIDRSNASRKAWCFVEFW